MTLRRCKTRSHRNNLKSRNNVESRHSPAGLLPTSCEHPVAGRSRGWEPRPRPHLRGTWSGCRALSSPRRTPAGRRRRSWGRRGPVSRPGPRSSTSGRSEGKMEALRWDSRKGDMCLIAPSPCPGSHKEAFGTPGLRAFLLWDCFTVRRPMGSNFTP